MSSKWLHGVSAVMATNLAGSGHREFVQLLPASESHHHAQPGGMLMHGLEVAQYALHFRAGWRLPREAEAEEQLEHAARYSYAVLVAALLHDIGKPIADLKVELAAVHGARAWVPIAGGMPEQGADWYRVTFAEPAARNYGAHARLAIVLLQRLVPARALSWLAHYPPVLEELTAYLSGDESVKRSAGADRDNAIRQIVAQADRQSVAENLRFGSRTRFATARAVPIIERLMDGLRRLLAEGGLPLNRAGATGCCDGESLWCVAKTLAEAVRQYLGEREMRDECAAGIQEGVASGALAYNESKARVHFLAEGMLVVTPGIFKDFAAAHPEAIELEAIDDGKVPEPWKAVQRDFQKTRLR